MINIDTSTIQIRSSNNMNSEGLLEFAHSIIPCKFGRNGIQPSKREGDGVTPIGNYQILYGYYRADRLKKPFSRLPMIPIKKNDGWCDDPESPNYNRPVNIPYPWHHEEMWREDKLYDICLVLDQNRHPRKRNRGSAIFFHLIGSQNRPTQGCIAITLPNMKLVLRRMDRETRIIIHP